ncbi:hypothetical protein V492_03465, partial [Pseudogymnoascus sp. VKM F-4246]
MPPTRAAFSWRLRVPQAGLLASVALLAEPLALLALCLLGRGRGGAIGLLLLEASADAPRDGGHLANHRLGAHQTLRLLAIRTARDAAIAIPIPLPYHTPAPQIRGARSTTQRRSIRPLPSQNSGFIVLPVALAEVETPVLGDEEEPDGGDDEAGADYADEREDGGGGDG